MPKFDCATRQPGFAPARPVLLRAEGLKIAFGGQIVLDGVNLDLCQGDAVLLRGENGSGKTTLLNILTGNLAPDSGCIHYFAKGPPTTYCFPRPWLAGLNPLDQFTPEFVARRGIGRAWQDIRLFGSQSVRDNIAVAAADSSDESPIRAMKAGLARTDHHASVAVDDLLAQFGLSDRGGSSADKISLGQAKRVAIARAVASGARILFLDEPLAGLDRAGITAVVGLLETLSRERGLTLVIAEHLVNQHHISGIVTRDWLLKDARLQDTAAVSPPSARQNSTLRRPEWISILGGNGATLADEPLPRGALLTRIRSEGVLSSRPVLEVRKLVVKRGPRVVIGINDAGEPSGFDLTVHEDEIAVLQAPNGWGKSTLLAAVTGLIPVDAGDVRLLNQSLNGLPPWRRAQNGMVATLADYNLFPNLLVREILKISPSRRMNATISAFANRKCGSLSGGQLQRVALATADVPASIRLFDEPFARLDLSGIADAASVLAPPPGAGVLILVPSSES